MTDLRTLGKAMRDAQRAYEAATDWDDFEETEKAMQAAEAAFDKALSEPPAALAPPYAEMAELVETAEQARLYARRLKGELRTKEQKQVEAFADAIISAGRRAEFEMARAERLEAALRPLLSDKARKLLTDHANAAHAMEDRDYRAIADALRMLLDKDAKARAALSTEAKAQGGER